MRTEFLCISVLRVASGPRVKLASCKSALNPPVVYTTDRSKAVVPVLVLFFVGLWFILRGDFLYVFSCVIFFLCFSSPFSIAITSLGEERANLSAFRTFVRFVLVWICRFPLPLGVWEGLRFVIVALPGLFSYLFLNLQALPLYGQNHSHVLRRKILSRPKGLRLIWRFMNHSYQMVLCHQIVTMPSLPQLKSYEKPELLNPLF